MGVAVHRRDRAQQCAAESLGCRIAGAVEVGLKLLKLMLSLCCCCRLVGLLMVLQSGLCYTKCRTKSKIEQLLLVSLYLHRGRRRQRT